MGSHVGDRTTAIVDDGVVEGTIIAVDYRSEEVVVEQDGTGAQRTVGLLEVF